MKSFSRYIVLLFLFLIVSSDLVCSADRGPSGSIKIGIFPFSPFNFFDQSGSASGIYPDLLREIAKDKKWSVEYVSCNWAQCLTMLQNGEIDLMPSVAFTVERAKTMDYNYESVVELWGQVFLRSENKSLNIDDLHDQQVGIMRRDISGSNFIKTASQLGVTCKIIEYPSHGDVFSAVANGEVIAGVAPQHFGLKHSKEYNVVGSSILFSPFQSTLQQKKEPNTIFSVR